MVLLKDLPHTAAKSCTGTCILFKRERGAPSYKSIRRKRGREGVGNSRMGWEWREKGMWSNEDNKNKNKNKE